MRNPYLWPFLFTIPAGIVSWMLWPDVDLSVRLFLAGVLIGTFITSTFCAIFADIERVYDIEPKRSKKESHGPRP
jgi:phosphotransferase system  glucose/maltose/N-acetylglucosamine-specific IIC component